jgi:hypothetical protein
MDVSIVDNRSVRCRLMWALAWVALAVGCGRVGFASHLAVEDAGRADAGATSDAGATTDGAAPPVDGFITADGGAPGLAEGGTEPRDGGGTAMPCPPACDATLASTELVILKSGEPDWLPLSGPALGGPWGTFSYFPSGPTLIYRFEAHDLDPGEYSLISYTDPWPGTPAIELARGAVATDGTLAWDWREREMNRDLTDLSGKVWLVPSAHLDTTAMQMTVWMPAIYLFEDTFITYDDTDVP